MLIVQSENEQRLQEVREQLQWTHEQQLAEVQHNFSESPLF